MFWNLFKNKKEVKEEQNTYKTWICYGIDDDGISIDINIEDLSSKSLDDFAKLLAGLSTMALLPDTLEIIREGLIDSPQLYTKIIEATVEHAKKEINYMAEQAIQEQSANIDEPIVKPSDLIK